MKWIKSLVLILIVISAFDYILLTTPFTYGSIAEVDVKDEFHVEGKFEPELWEKIQTLQSNGTTKDLSLIIWLVEDERITGMQIGPLKNYASSLFTGSHGATVYSVCRVLPVVMAKVPVLEAEKMASYEFVESIGDGERTGYVTLDVSRPAIEADYVETVLGYDGDGIEIAILDSGIDDSHPDLDDGKVIHHESFVDWDDNGVPDEGPNDLHGHGTHVAGIAAGTGEMGYRGIAPGAWLLNIKVCKLRFEPEPKARFKPDDVINGIDEAIYRHVDVISMSLGDPSGTRDGTSLLSMAADRAVEQGIVVVVSAGNEGENEGAICTPGDAFNVITVGSVYDGDTEDIGNDVLSDFSSRGPTVDGTSKPRPKPDVVAPGEDIIAPMDQSAAYWEWYPELRVGDYYARIWGTSMATPHVSGTVALMLEANPNLTPAQVKAILRQTARLNNDLNGRTVNERGYGIIDAADAIDKALNINSIDMNHMYDQYDVETPWLWEFPYFDKDFLDFTVSAPSSYYGIPISQVYRYKWKIESGAKYFKVFRRLCCRHVWIDEEYYDLATDMNKYLLSGPRIYAKGDGWVKLRAKYEVGSVIVEYDWKMAHNEIWLKLDFNGGSSWDALLYFDPDVWDTLNYAFLPSGEITILRERIVWYDCLLDIRDEDHDEYIQIDPEPADHSKMYVLKYDYPPKTPDAANDGEYILDENIVVLYLARSDLPDPGPTIYIKDNPPATPDPTQNDADTGGDAGNNFNQATEIDAGYNTGILCDDPEDHNDWYKFQVENGSDIRVSLITFPEDVDFDLELYDPEENLKNASYLGPGLEDEVTYPADLNGSWRARINQYYGEAQYHLSVSIESGGGGGGCPILYVYDGKEYMSEGLLDIHNPEGPDVVRNHTLITKPKKVNDEYLLRLTEHPLTISHIDKVTLFAILEDKTLLELTMISAIHSEHGDVLPQLLLSDDLRTDTYGANHNNGTSQSIDLEFQALPPTIKAVGFIFQIEGNNPEFAKP